METNKRIGENADIFDDLNNGLSPFILSLNFAGALTYRTVGPTIGLIFPIIKNNMPFAFLSVVFLDFLAAFAVKRSIIEDAQMSTPFEAAWRNPRQGNIFAGQSKAQENDPSSSLPDDAVFTQGVSMSLALDAPLDTGNTESSAVFIIKIIKFRHVPKGVLPVVALLMNIVSRMRCKNTSN